MEILHKVEFNLLNRVEHIVENGEIARYEQFLLLSQCFQKSSAVDASESIGEHFA